MAETIGAATTSSSVRAAALEWSGKVRLELESAPEELVVRFDRPIAESKIKQFASTAGADLADLRWNDNSLVLRPAAGRRINARAGKRNLYIEFLPDGDAEPQSVNKPKENDTAIDAVLVRAQADAAAGYTGQARRRLASLAKRYPGDVRVQRALADAEVIDGATVSAAERYRALGVEDPAALRAIAEANGNVSSGLTIRAGKTFAQREVNLVEGRLPVRSGLTVRGGIRHFATHADSVSGAAGELSDINSKSTIGDIRTVIRLGSASTLMLQGSALFDAKVIGIGARLHAGSQERQARLSLAYKLPDLSTAEQATYGGYVSRLGFGGTLRLTPELLSQGDVTLNGYGLADQSILSRTIGITGGLDYLLRRGSPSLALNYRFDAEYVTWARTRPNGLDYIPLSDRENHSLQVASSLSLSSVQLNGAVGWTKDWRGDSGGPTANAGVAARLGSDWNVEANGGVSSVSGPAISGRQLYLRVSLSRFLKKRR